MPTALYRLAEASGAKAQNVEFLATDIAAGTRTNKCLNLIIEIDITAGTNPDLEITFDSGSTWIIIANPKVGTYLRLKIMAMSTDQINFRSPTAGGLTLSRFTVIGDLDA